MRQCLLVLALTTANGRAEISSNRRKVARIELSEDGLQSWCDFLAIEAVSRGEPLVIADAFDRGNGVRDALNSWPDVPEDHVPYYNAAQQVPLDYYGWPYDSKPYETERNSVIRVPWAEAQRLLTEKHAEKSFTFMLNRRGLADTDHPFWSKFVDALPDFLLDFDPAYIMTPCNGFDAYTTFLHFDDDDNMHVVLRGKKTVLLYPPWDTAYMSACGENDIW
jgi:hypothetical protein